MLNSVSVASGAKEGVASVIVMCGGNRNDNMPEMPTDHILDLLLREKTKIDAAIAALQGTSRGGRPRKNVMPATDTTPTPNHARKRRRWTEAMREAARQRSKAMWIKRRKAAKKG